MHCLLFFSGGCFDTLLVTGRRLRFTILFALNKHIHLLHKIVLYFLNGHKAKVVYFLSLAVAQRKSAFLRGFDVEIR